MPIVNPSSKIFVSGHLGMVGGTVCDKLRKRGYHNILTASRQQLDLTDQSAVFKFYATNRPDAQIMCAATVGGIHANYTYPADFIGKNLMLQTNQLEAARRYGCQRTIFLASGCVYPRDAEQPIKEESLLTAPLEPTNKWYAVAKIAGVKMGQAYNLQHDLNITSVFPCNIYGEYDSFDSNNSHVVASLLHKTHLAKTSGAEKIEVWGTGKALREFIYSDDLAEILVMIMEQDDVPDLLNIGTGKNTSIDELAQLVCKTVGYEGKLEFDTSYPDGTPKKLLDSSKLRNTINWHPKFTLEEGLARTYSWYCASKDKLRTKLNIS